MESYRESYQARLETIVATERNDSSRLLASYRSRVEGELERFQRAGDLDAVQALRSELNRLDEHGADLESLRENPVPSLQSLQQILDQSLMPLHAKRLREEAELTGHYIRALDQLIATLVRDGEIDSALAAREEKSRSEKRLEEIADSSDPGPSLGEGTFPPALMRGLVLRYSFDGEEEDRVVNEVSNRLGGLFHGARRTQRGRFGAAAEFTGPSDRIAIDGELPDMASMTFAAWIDNGGEWQQGGIFSDYDDAPGRDVFLSLVAPSGVFVRADKDGATLQASLDFAGKWRRGWNHLVWILESRESTLYLNGELVGVIEQPGSNRGNHAAWLGHSHNGSRLVGFRGKLDEVCIWRRGLTEDEVKLLYEFSP